MCSKEERRQNVKYAEGPNLDAWGCLSFSGILLTSAVIFDMVVVIGRTGCNVKHLLGKILICFGTQSHADGLGVGGIYSCTAIRVKLCLFEFKDIIFYCIPE